MRNNEQNQDTEIVQKLLSTLQQIHNYSYVSVTQLMRKAGIDQDEIEFMELFQIQREIIAEAGKAGIKMDYSEFDGTTSGVPFNEPAVVIKPGGVTGMTFFWESWGMGYIEDVSRVVTKILQDEIQIRRYNVYELVDGGIFRLYGQQKASLFSLLEQGMKKWTQDDYSVEVCDGWHWKLHIYSGKKIIRRLEGTVEAPPYGDKIRNIIKRIVGEDNLYIF